MADDPERYVVIEPVETRERYRWMADWADQVDEEDLREMLEIALDGKGAFGRFRDVVSRYPDLEAHWRATEERLLLEIAEDWLREDLGIEPVYELPAPKPPQAQPTSGQRDRSRRELELLDVLLLGGPDSGDERFTDSVHRRVPTRSTSEARRLFKKLAREVCEWNGVAWRKRFIKGNTSLEMGRFHLDLRDDAVELSVDVPHDVWEAFGPRPHRG